VTRSPDLPEDGPTDDPADDRAPDPEDLAAFSEEMDRHTRMLHLLKGQLSTTLPGGLDWAAVAMLLRLVRCGPRRQGELAERALLDPSTVSRYVAHLVRAGMVERRPDPDDGRAVQLVATPAGQAVQEQVTAQRAALLRRVFDRWSAADLHDLTRLLRRFNDDMVDDDLTTVRDGPPRHAPTGAHPGPRPAAPSTHDHLEP
jgi:DNA-binding MarR family transcriptional regulator